MIVTDTHVFFYGGPFSQWAACKFTARNVVFNCAEQYMMAMKASVMEDDETAEKIMKSFNPKEQKKLGRQVKNFDAARWDRLKYDIVLKGNFYKFRQNPGLMRHLMDTEDKIIVEASPYDRIWGIGLGMEDKRIYDESQWQGENLLGKVLMEVRELEEHV